MTCSYCREPVLDPKAWWVLVESSLGRTFQYQCSDKCCEKVLAAATLAVTATAGLEGALREANDRLRFEVEMRTKLQAELERLEKVKPT